MKKSRLRDRKLGVKKVEKKKSNNHLFKYLLIVFSVVILFLVLGYLLLPKNWNGKEKIAIAIQKEEGEGEVIILDPSNPSITKIDIPSNTEVNAANQLGVWKMGSITKLAIDEKLNGSLLKNTVIKSFNFPIDFWADENLVNLISGNLLKAISGVFKVKNTSLSFIDKIRIASYSLGVNNSQRFLVNLSDTNYLQKSQLKDSSLGWTVGESIPAKVEIFFNLQNDARQNLLINNKSSLNTPAIILSKTVEVLGLNVASIEKNTPEDFDCKIIGSNKEIVEKLANIFSCVTNIQKPANNFDLEIDIGTKFKDRF